MKYAPLLCLFVVCGTLFVQPAEAAVLSCDVNGDSVVNASDVQLYINKALGVTVEVDANVNSDGNVNAVDVRDGTEIDLDAVKLPKQVVLEPTDSDGARRRYSAKVLYKDMLEPQAVVFTPYADAGNEGARFRAAFPPAGA